MKVNTIPRYLVGYAKIAEKVGNVLNVEAKRFRHVKGGLPTNYTLK